LSEKIINFVFVYILTWWIVLFCVLPFWINREDKPEAGNDTGAPKAPKLKKKFIATSLISLVITYIILEVITINRILN